MFRHIPLKNFVRTGRFPRNTLISIKLHFSVGKPTCQQFQAEPSHTSKLAPERCFPNRGACFPSPGCGGPPRVPCVPQDLHTVTKPCPSCPHAGEDLEVLLMAVKPWCNSHQMGCSSQGLTPHPRIFPSPGTPTDLWGQMVLESIHAWNGQASSV